MVRAFEGNRAETKTTLPVIESFMAAHQLPDVTAVDASAEKIARKRKWLAVGRPDRRRYRYDHAFCSQPLAALIAECGYLHQPRTEKLSDHSALSIRLNLAPPQSLPVSDPVTATELPTLF